jgi:mycoredoxin
MTNNTADIVVYTTKWCPACWRAKQVMKSMQVDYVEVDIANDNGAAEHVMLLNRGYRSVPTIVFPDGSHLSEPQIHDLKEKLNSYT